VVTLPKAEIFIPSSIGNFKFIALLRKHTAERMSLFSFKQKYKCPEAAFFKLPTSPTTLT
jgi:hypothetical protein